jgi:hypothetical protein
VHDWTPELQETLRHDARCLLVDGVRKLDLAARVVRLLEGRGIRALPMKGAALAERFHTSVAERPMADVDVLVLDSFVDASRILLEAGFALVACADHAHAFHDPSSGAVAELHSNLTSSGIFPVDPDGLWRRRVSVSGQVETVPGVEDLLVQLALHAAFQHGLVLSLVQWLDFRLLLELGAPDPQGVLARTRETGAESSLAAALEAARAVTNVSVPEDLSEAVREHLPSCVRRWASEPLSFVVPSRPRVARLRWELARGKRWSMVRRTLAEGDTRPGWSQFARAGSLARRFGPAFFS